MEACLGRNKIVSAAEAVEKIKDGATVTTSGFLGAGFAEEVAIALEERFLNTGSPRGLTFLYAAGQGDGKTLGLNHVGHEGLVRRLIGSHLGLAPKLQALVRENKILAYNLPQGIVTHLFRDVAGKKPCTVSRIGLGTFIDPRVEGGKLNELTRREGEDIVQVTTLWGTEYLLYKTHPVDVALVRGTTADPDGNVTMEKEALTLEVLSQATAAKNNGGIVIVQVERIAERGSLNARQVRIPGIMVDYIVVAKPANHRQTFGEPYSPVFSCEIRVPVKSILPMAMSERKIIARRAAFELRPNNIVNLGIGMPEGIALIANEEGIGNCLTLTVESGVIGGIPHGGLNFGTATNMACLIDHPCQFDFYDGGGLNIAFLGAAEMDEEGNVNVSKFGRRFVGPGGFINVGQSAGKVCFTGTFTAGKLDVSVENGMLKINREGANIKFRKMVRQKTFSGKQAVLQKQPVLFITERCVFELTEDGMELIEIAPGVDLKKDILAQMEFTPIMKNPPKLMDARIFRLEPMGIKEDLFFKWAEENNYLIEASQK